MNKSKQVKTFKSAKLVQYKGGGYDGCYWEWNYALLVDNVFHDVYSSGRNAIKDKKSLLEYVKNKDSVYIYNLNKKSDILEFTNRTNETTQGEIISEVNRILGSETMFFNCTYCENSIYPMNDRPHDADYPQFFHDENSYHGNGGVGIVYTTVLCEDCYCNRCTKCDCTLSPDEHYTLDDESACKYCFEENMKEVG